MGLEITKEQLEKAGISIQQSPADAVTIIGYPEDGTYFLYVTKKGSLPTEAKRAMFDDIDTVIEFVRGVFPKTTASPAVTQQVDIGLKQEIGFLAKAA